MHDALNPWTRAMLIPLWTCHRLAEVAFKTCDPKRWGGVDLEALLTGHVPRCRPRLNPIEFHGCRPPSALPPRDDAANDANLARSRMAAIG